MRQRRFIIVLKGYVKFKVLSEFLRGMAGKVGRWKDLGF